MAQALRSSADDRFATLTVEGLDVAEALRDGAFAPSLADLAAEGMLTRATTPTGGLDVVVDLATGDLLVGGDLVGNLLAGLGLRADRATLTVDLGCRQPVAATGAVRRALGLGLQEAVAIVKSTGPVTLGRADLVGILVEAIADCGRRNAEHQAGRLRDGARLLDVMSPTLA